MYPFYQCVRFSEQRQFDYTDRDDVRHSEILVPHHLETIDWIHDREQLWNGVEQIEKRKDAQLARSIIVALPRELTLEQNIDLLREHVREEFVARGMIADMAVHDKAASDGLPQPHGHILLTVREVNAQGEWEARKNRDWNQRHLVEQWRSAWEVTQNAYLETAGLEERISMQSYERQGVNRVPTQHMGARATLLEAQGIRTEIGERNRTIEQENAMRTVMDAMFPATPMALDSQREAEAEPQMAVLPDDEVARMQSMLVEEQQQEMEIGRDDE